MYKNDADNLATVCVLCSHNCALRVDVRDNAITEVRGDPDSPISRGYVCNKAFTIDRYSRHDQRVTHPLRRRPDGSFQRVSWSDAIADIAARLGAVLDAHGPRAIGLVGVGGQANHLDAAYALGFLRGLGSNRWFNAFAQEKTQHNLLDQWMCDASPATFLHPDHHGTRLLLLLGTNPRISNRGHNATDTLKELARDDGRRVIAVDPRETETTRGADQHIAVKPGTDCYLLLGVAASIAARDLYDRAFVAQRAAGFEALRAALAEVDVDAMAARCGVPRAVIDELARELATTRPAAILCDLGVEQTPFSTLNAYLIRVLLALTGNLGRPGGNLFYEAFNPPDPRGAERGETERALVSGIPAIRALGSYAMFSPSLVPEEVLCDHPERLRALIVEGANPLLSFSDTARWREACARLDLLVVIDPAMTETAQLADYVLPTPTGYEKWEISGFPKHWPEIHAQLRPPVVRGPDEALPEAEIYARLAEAMNLFGPPPRAVRALAPLARRSTAARAAIVAAASVAASRRRRGQRGRGVQNKLIFWLYRTLGARLPAPALTAVWLLCFKNATMRRAAVLRTLGPAWRWRSPFAIADELFRRMLAHPEGVEVARLSTDDNLGDHLGFRDGRVRLAPEPMVAELRRALAAEPVDDPAFPLILSAGLRTRWTANTIHRDPAWRRGAGPHCALTLSPTDAEALGVRDGADVRLETARGAAVLPAAIDARLRPGHVAVPNGFGMRHGDAVDGVNLNELTAASDRDPFTGCPHHKAVRCRVSPA